MKNKIVYGAYGGVNAGDEYILHSIKKNSSNDEMSIICEWPNISAKTLEYYKNYKIKPIRRNEVLKVLKEVISKDLVIGGGQIINGGPAIKSMFYIAFLVIINKLTLNEPSIFSAGTGEIKSRPDRILARIIFKLCKVVLMRDENSYQQAKIYSNRAKKTADVVFTNGLLQSKERKNILIAVHGSPSVKYQDDSTIHKIITTLLENGFDRENIKIIAHDRRINYDVKVAEHLADKFSLNYRVLETPLEVNNEFEKASTVISARMHPLIIGSLYKCNLFYFGNSKKIKDLAKETNIENAAVVLEDIQRLNNCSKIKIDGLLKDSLANFTYMEI